MSDTPLSHKLYEQDFHAWAKEQSALLRSGKLSIADIEHIAEEIESMGKTEQREMENRLMVLLLHLLKWQFQPKRRGSSWEATIKIQRRDLARHINHNPSLKPLIDDAISYAYGNAIIAAADETGLSETTFFTECPWSFDQIANSDFWPSHDKK